MKKILVFTILLSFIFMFSIYGEEVDSCSSIINDEDKCNSSTENGEKCIWTGGYWTGLCVSKKEVEISNERNDATKCTDFHRPDTCNAGIGKDGARFGCAWNEKYKFCSPSGLLYLS